MSLTRLVDIDIAETKDEIDENVYVVAQLYNEPSHQAFYELGYGFESRDEAVLELRRQIKSDSYHVCDFDPSWARLLTSRGMLEMEYDEFD